VVGVPDPLPWAASSPAADLRPQLRLSRNRLLDCNPHAVEVDVSFPSSPRSIARARFLNSIWERAASELRAARNVAVVGYSLPATDPRAQSKLLSAIRENPHDQHVHVVLGDDIGSATSRRMKELLKSARGEQILL
jgi:hypothetical protein